MDVKTSPQEEKRILAQKEDERIAHLMREKEKHENMAERIKIELRKIMYQYDRKI